MAIISRGFSGRRKQPMQSYQQDSTSPLIFLSCLLVQHHASFWIDGNLRYSWPGNVRELQNLISGL